MWLVKYLVPHDLHLLYQLRSELGKFLFVGEHVPKYIGISTEDSLLNRLSESIQFMDEIENLLNTVNELRCQSA